MARFSSRTTAGRELAEQLTALEPEPVDGIVLGIPRGGLAVAAEVARALRLPLAPLVIAKIGAPGNSEYAVGAVGPDSEPVLDEATGYEDADELERSIGSAREKVESLQAELGTIETGELHDRLVIVVDDGLATGRTMRLALRWLREAHPRRIVVAVPVAPPDTVEELEPLADRIIVLHQPEWFGGVGAFYDHFPQVSTSEARTILFDLNAEWSQSRLPDR